MTEQTKPARRAAPAALAAAATALVALSACQPAERQTRAPIDYRGTQPGVAMTAPATSAPATASPTGVASEGGVSYLRAQSGDTVATLTNRYGYSASEIAAYNGLRPDSQLQAGDELVVPDGATPSGTRVAAASSLPPTTPIEATPLPPSGTATVGGGVRVNPDGSLATDQAATATPSTAAATEGTPAWSPNMAADAIARSTGVRSDGSLGAPPSSTEPVPPEPRRARDLRSPRLDQYRTDASSGGATPAAPVEPRVVEVTPTAPAPGSALKLTRPVRGSVALGFGEVAGGARNDGIDFAAPAGSEVVAAADGEVALVSDTLGKLGTIVLIRHADEILTVYGRVDQVGVGKGDIVRRGQRIGVVSDAAAPEEPRMHFEVRRGATVLDPTPFL